MLAELAPREPEAQGLVALLELQSSRLAARTDREGRPILLQDQDRARWDHLLIRRGLAALSRSEALIEGMADAGGVLPGPYVLQAAIAACHARAATAQATDWARIAELYAVLARVRPSPVVELNRAVAVGMARGPRAGLEIVDALRDAPALRHYQWLPSVRADLLTKLGRYAEARAELMRAVALTANVRERELLLERVAALPADAP
jgi:predicted RNA polymerase sigma factor